MKGAKGAAKARQRGRVFEIDKNNSTHYEAAFKVKDQQIIIPTAHKPRRDWKSKFHAMAKNGDDELLDKNELSRLSGWDQDEWEW